MAVGDGRRLGPPRAGQRWAVVGPRPNITMLHTHEENAKQQSHHARSGRGNWHLLSESELTELCLALGVPPDQTGNMTKVGLIAALRTRLVMSKHRGVHGASSSRFERLPPPSFADSRVEAQGSPPRRGLGDASRSQARSRSRGALGDTSNRDATRTRQATGRRGRMSTWKRSAHKNFDMTVDDLNDMEETFRKRLHNDAYNKAAGWMAEQHPLTLTSTGEAERSYENSVLEYGLQINSMVQQGTVGCADNSRISGGIAAPGTNGRSELAAMDASFALLERRMADASMTIDDSCRAAAVGSTVDEMLDAQAANTATTGTRRAATPAAARQGTGRDGGGVAEASPDSTVASPESAASSQSVAASRVSSQGTETISGAAPGAFGLAPWLENGGAERFGLFDRDGNGVLDRQELEHAVGTFFSLGEGQNEEAWANAVQLGLKMNGMPKGETPEAREALKGGEEWAERLRRDMPGLSVNAQLREQ